MRSEIIKEFLRLHTHQDLFYMYDASMQCNVIVGSDGGDSLDNGSWQDEHETWHPFVIQSEESDNKKLFYNFEKHVEGIGMTGWNWEEKTSHWLAYDFDSMVNHKQGLTKQELDDIQEQLSDIPWVSIRKSTSALGYHIYVHLDPVIPTENRAEHAALARAVLHKLTALTGYNFKDKVDICGGNMWVWHRKLANTIKDSVVNGLKLIKEGIPLENVPNWEEHKDIIKGLSSPKNYDTLSQAKSNIKLDSNHKSLIQWLENAGQRAWWWDNDRHMLVCHTIDLRDAHKELSLKGVFKTDSTGTSQQNCFCFPLRNGSWCLRRFSRGCMENRSWEQDGGGWTRCYYNVDLDLKTSARIYGGLEHPTGGYCFQTTDIALQCLNAIGIPIKLGAFAYKFPAKVKQNKDGRLLVEVEDEKNLLAGDMEGWLYESKRWKKLFNQPRKAAMSEDLDQFDDQVRYLTTETGEEQGWIMNIDGDWVWANLTNIKLAFQSMGYKHSEIGEILGSAVLKKWKLVNIPFAAEYPGDRRWNIGSAQFKYQPATNVPTILSDVCPNWYSVFQHTGRGLDKAVADDPWCKEHRIRTGADYLIAWVASLFQYPTEPLPYLFLYGSQNTGKSVFHEALATLVTSGVCDADTALTSSGNFNGELASSVLAVIEEIDLSQSRESLNRIKKWVTSPMITIHEKGKTPYIVKNTTHFIQTANDYKYCPVFEGDTRIVVINVPKLDKLIPKRRFMELLNDESPDFMSFILNYNIPESPDRLNVPVVESKDKAIIAEQNKPLVQQFIEEKCKMVMGHMILFSDFQKEFMSWVGASEYWSAQRLSKEIPPYIGKGRAPKGNQVNLINISFDFAAKPQQELYINDKGKILTVGMVG